MTKTLKSVGLFLATAMISVQALAQLPSGTITGQSDKVPSSWSDPNAMALIIQNDQASNKTYAILAEYDRKAYTHIVTKPAVGLPLGSEGAYLTSWVPRMHIYEVEKFSAQRYLLKPLHVDDRGDIVAKPDTRPDVIWIKTPGTLLDARLLRFEKDGKTIAEQILLDGKYPANSTWEPMIPAKYFGTKDSTGGDYMKKDVNASLFPDGNLVLSTPEVQGSFTLTEKLPRMFVVSSVSSNNVGAEQVENRIAVFIDIVNWKGLKLQRFTTEEMLLINPNDPNDLGFYYERH